MSAMMDSETRIAANRRRPRARASWLALVLVTTAGCAKLEKEKTPQIVTDGPHAVVLGATITLNASTLNGTDAAYTWASADPAIATVDDAGVVTGVGVGETSMTATGARTKAVASHAIVVLAPSDQAQIPYYDKWLQSGHADPTAAAYTHFSPMGMVQIACARCHSSEGFVDYLGGDGTAAGQVDRAAPSGSLIRCVTCHNPTADALSAVTFPSGAIIENLGGEARCMTCHQGRSSGSAVDAAIKAASVKSDDEVSTALSPNAQSIHYYPAAATLFAGRAAGGYQYAGQVYDARFRHVDGFDTCTGCHDPHSTKVRFDQCVGCHPAAKDVAGARQIRMMSSAAHDYDGDGDLSEGIHGELVGLRDKLLALIVRYGTEHATPLCYSAAAYPYWFLDTNADGGCSAAESKSDNAFKSWTPRLLRAAYNFQMASKDPGAFAHNAKYIIELLYDSATNLNDALLAKVDLSKTVRTDSGHFNGASEAARHWDDGEQVDATCSACHGGRDGFRFYVQYGVGKVVPETANGLECATCHDKLNDTFDVAKVPSVTFASGVVRKEEGSDNLCSSCHRGRESKATIDKQIATGKYVFKNVHYLPAAATKLGSAVHMGYEYDAKTYAGPLVHAGGVQCTSCHDPKGSRHTFLIADAWEVTCKTCHADANGEPAKIRRTHLLDYDGDGNATESLSAEIDGLAAKALAAMQAAVPAPSLCYSPVSYPYFFKDTDGDKVCGASEAMSANAFAAWTPALMKAAHNFQLSRKDPGGWAHNFDYLGQLLFDSVESLGGPTAALTRP